MYIYKVFKEEINSPEIGKYDSFGVVIYESTGVKTEKEVLRVSDISPDMEAVKKLSDLCAAEQVEPIHFLDVIEDYIYS